jgi:hypothetical protein
MSIWTQRVVAIASLVVAIALLIWSSPQAKPGYEFPRMVAFVMLGLSAALTAMAFKPGKVLIPADIESIPLRIIWPMLIILAVMAFLAPRLGFLATSFVVFTVTGLVFSPERFSLRRLGMVAFIGLCFTTGLYLLFVRFLNVRLPSAWLF